MFRGGRPKIPPTPSWQVSVGSFFKPIGYWQDATILQNPDPQFRHAAVQFRMRFEKQRASWNYLGTVGDYCYYCDYDCLEYHAYSPFDLHLIPVAKLNIDDVDYLIIGIDVMPQFQRKRIGSNLVIFANQKVREQYGRPILAIIEPEGVRPRHGIQRESYLTQEGKKLVMWCYHHDILSYDQLIGNTPEPSSGSESGGSPRRRPRNHHSPPLY